MISIYRSPKVKVQESFIEFVKSIVHEDRNRPVILCGDININLLGNSKNSFSKTMSELGFL